MMSYGELREILAHANSFEWDATSDPSRTRPKNPDKFLTPACFWAMTNSQYFPFAAFLLATDEDANEAMLADIRQAACEVPEDPEELNTEEALLAHDMTEV